MPTKSHNSKPRTTHIGFFSGPLTATSAKTAMWLDRATRDLASDEKPIVIIVTKTIDRVVDKDHAINITDGNRQRKALSNIIGVLDTRGTQGYGVRPLARLLQVSPTTMSRLMNGQRRMTIPYLQRLLLVMRDSGILREFESSIDHPDIDTLIDIVCS